jgi:hypothetical protein
MESEFTLSYAVMEGGGAYNRHATFQAGGARLAIPFLEKAAREVSVGPADLPVVIADYGLSQGKNSRAPVRIAIGELRPRLGPHRCFKGSLESVTRYIVVAHGSNLIEEETGYASWK